MVRSGRVYCWGYNGDGQLGTGDASGPSMCNGHGCSPSPVQVRGIDSATGVAVGLESSCAVVRGGRVYCWGANAQADLGLGTTKGPNSCSFGLACSTSPLRVADLSDATDVSVGDGYACALRTGGTVSCWGANSSNTIGTGQMSGPDSCALAGSELPCALRPNQVQAVSTAVAISAGTGTACAVLGNGHVRCWGTNAGGALGSGTSVGPRTCKAPTGITFACSPSPVEVRDLDNAVDVSVGGGYACALTAKKTVKCWGHNYAGTLGIGTNSGPETCNLGESITACATAPQPVTTLSDVNAVATGFSHACASRGSGEILCWGTNAFGELGIGGTGGAEQCHVNIYINDTDGCSTTPVKVVVGSQTGDGSQSEPSDPQ